MTFRTFMDDAGIAFDFQRFFDPKLELRFTANCVVIRDKFLYGKKNRSAKGGVGLAKGKRAKEQRAKQSLGRHRQPENRY